MKTLTARPPLSGLTSLAALALLVAACGGGGGPAIPASTPTAVPTAASPEPVEPTRSSSEPHTITIDAFEFMPSRLTVRVDDKVTWTNEEDSLHTVTSGSPDARTDLFDSGEFDTGETFEFTFDRPGTYAFFCDRHEFMRGEVVVEP